MSRRRRKAEEEEHGPDERWMASYMDMVTVLMCMFIVLFAMSTVDQEKFEQLRNSLATGFGASESEIKDVSNGVVVPVDLVDDEGEGFTDLELAMEEVAELRRIRDQINANLTTEGLQHTVSYRIDERGLTVRLVGSETFFDPNSIDLTGVAPRVLDSIAPVLLAARYHVSVEGHADYRQAVHPFPTNWELSSGRATQVLRHLVERGSLQPERMSSVGFGASRPVIAGTDPAALAQNRRVDIVVLSDKPEAVRALIPGIIEGELGTPAAPTGPSAEPVADPAVEWAKTPAESSTTGPPEPPEDDDHGSEEAAAAGKHG